jgi:nitrogen fixation/metabolism regulation signal transduction histidine kinase
MSVKRNSSKSLTEYDINIKVKLAALWATLMFLYIYADFFQLMTPKKLEKMIDLQTPMGPTSPEILVIFSVILIVPSLMIFLSVFLNSQINKWLNICIAALYASMSILIIVSTLGSEWHTFYILFNLIEVFVFAMIIYQAWKWPKIE